jgi:hypothetical protein
MLSPPENQIGLVLLWMLSIAAEEAAVVFGSVQAIDIFEAPRCPNVPVAFGMVVGFTHRR